MAWIVCPCGHRLSNVREENWQFYLVPVPRSYLPTSVAQQDDLSHLWQCERCSRIWIDDADGKNGQWYKPES